MSETAFTQIYTHRLPGRDVQLEIPCYVEVDQVRSVALKMENLWRFGWSTPKDITFEGVLRAVQSGGRSQHIGILYSDGNDALTSEEMLQVSNGLADYLGAELCLCDWFTGEQEQHGLRLVHAG